MLLVASTGAARRRSQAGHNSGSDQTYLIVRSSRETSEDFDITCLLLGIVKLAGKEQITLRRRLGSIGQEIDEGDIDHTRVVMQQEGQKLLASTDIVISQYLRDQAFRSPR